MSQFLAKFKGFVFWCTAVSLVFVIVSNLFAITAKSALTGVTKNGTQVGGRITYVTPVGCLAPPEPTDPLCVSSLCVLVEPIPVTNAVAVTPFGYSATNFCPAVQTATTGGVFSVESVGKQVLGLFGFSGGIHTQIGVIGVSL